MLEVSVEAGADSVVEVIAAEVSAIGVSAIAVAGVVSVDVLETSDTWFPEAKGLDSDGSMDKYCVMSEAGASVVGVAAVEVSFVAVSATGDSSRFAAGATSAGVLSAGTAAVEALFLSAVATGVVPVVAGCGTAAFVATTLVMLVAHSTGDIVAATELVAAEG